MEIPFPPLLINCPMDLTVIQDKLRRQAFASSQHSLDIPIDWPANGELITYSPDRMPATNLTNTVESLRRRSLRAYGESAGGRATVSLPQTANPAMAVAPRQGTVGSHNPYSGVPLIDPACPQPAEPSPIYQQRLQSVVDKINHLSVQQRRAIAELQATHSQLAGVSVGKSDLGHGFFCPQITLDRAATASAELDHQGNIRLTYQPLRLNQPDREARQLAGHLRQTYGTGSTLPAPSRFARSLMVKILGVLSQEPLDWLAWGWRSIESPFTPASNGGKRSPQGSPQVVRGGRRTTVFPSFIDTLLWLGGGVITRLALDLLLSAFSGLWPLTVMVITAIVAYTLYQATLASRPNLGLANRVFLALAGVFIGGYL